MKISFEEAEAALGVEKGCADEDILKKAYRKAALKW